MIEEVQVAQAEILSLLMSYISSIYDALRKRANAVKVADQPEVTCRASSQLKAEFFTSMFTH